MLYISGIHALNLPCSLSTCGDWHQSAIQWKKPYLRDSSDSFWGDYGIEYNVKIPEHDEVFNAANHIRALLDLLETGNFSVAQGMNNDFICNKNYDYEVFSQIAKLKIKENWSEIDRFMGSEYKCKWLDYKESSGI
jgi:hypothetical protein